MSHVINPIRLNRRGLLHSLGASAAALSIGALSSPARAQSEEVLTEALVLRDPDIPVAGNAAGDISIDASAVDFTTVVVSQTSALSARLQLAQIKVSQQTAAVTLITDLGGGWKAPDYSHYQ